MKIKIRPGTIAQVVTLSQQIPEFINPHPFEEYQSRLANRPHLILIAYVEEKSAGFKVGYEKEDYFYSWMGAILPEFRRNNIATLLAEEQERWASQKGYSHITFKTRNYLKPMLLFAIKRGFNILAVDKRPNIEDYRIILRKKLTR